MKYFVTKLIKTFQMILSLPLVGITSLCGGLLTYHIIPRFREMFIKANLFGIDLNKSSGDKVPEATGVITGCVFLMICFIMIPFTYSDYFLLDQSLTPSFPHSEFAQLIAALLSITCMLLLGRKEDKDLSLRSHEEKMQKKAYS